MSNVTKFPKPFAKNPGGPNPLTLADVDHIRATVGMEPAVLFKAGFDTRQIAQILNWSEAKVYNAQSYLMRR